MNPPDFDPGKLATLYYFGELQYWKLPSLAVEALVNGYDGPALRRLAGLSIFTQSAKALVHGDVASEEIDSAFREMGVAAPLSQREAGLSLAAEAARRAIDGDGNVFDEATHIRNHILWEQSIPELVQIAELSLQARSAPRNRWAAIEEELRAAMSSFLSSSK